MGVYSYGFKGVVAGAKAGATKLFQKLSGQGKTTGTEVIKSFPIAKNLKKKKEVKDDMVKSFDKALSGARDEAKVEIKSKNPLSKFTKKAADIIDKKATGSRVGRKFGNPKPKTNVDKIKKAFPTKTIKFDAKKSDLNKDGRLTSYEKKRGMAIAKAMRGRNKNV